jgi:putative (di)nucleoside polyphosphate hydrolase
VRKAFSYVTRENGSVTELLVFAHTDPESGIQVPKGTVEGGEAPEAAARREAFEECGVAGLELVRHLATDVVHFPSDPANFQVQERHFYHLRATGPTLARWTHTVSAGGEDKGMTFLCFWLPLSECEVLVANMGDYLHLLR